MDEEAKPAPTWGFDGDDAETVVARAIYASGVTRVRAEVAQLDVQSQRIRRVFESARREADRSAAILIFALIEDLMLESFKNNLSGSNIKGGWDEITRGDGLLATANDRLSLLGMLDWMQPKVYEELRLLKSIRNRFAHHADVDGFDDRNIRSWIGALHPAEKAVPAAVGGPSACPGSA